MVLPPRSVKQFVCGNRIRCGNGSPTTKLTDTGCDCNCTQVLPKIWDQPVNINKTYGFDQDLGSISGTAMAQREEAPGFYFDISQPPIGGRPVIVHSNRQDIPNMLLVNTTNLPGINFDCRQPCWGSNCM